MIPRAVRLGAIAGLAIGLVFVVAVAAEVDYNFLVHTNFPAFAAAHVLGPNIHNPPKVLLYGAILLQWTLAGLLVGGVLHFLARLRRARA